jgi:large conductance mechanosensitive channel
MRTFFKEFKEFVSAGNLVELAVAFILGLAIKAVIDAFIQNVVNPIIGAIVGKPNLDNVLKFTLRHGDDTVDAKTGAPVSGDSVLAIGAVLTQVVSLILVGLVLFMMIKGYNKLRRAPSAAAAGPSDNELLGEIRDLLRDRP